MSILEIKEILNEEYENVKELIKKVIKKDTRVCFL